ncbi:HEAT repeat domain-containing protein [Oscillatoria amoena NRMC-F 0135]|nr:HEAT repeat domain-containing protein [Geitlerinema splendidum]MDL5044774.1 HEAT repeat domain-containing protein [Oscillatoria amoena NRMC-F 0135]
MIENDLALLQPPQSSDAVTRLQWLLNQAESLEGEEYSQILEFALTALSWGDFQQRWDIAKLFPKLGTGAIAPLIALLEDEQTDWELRWFVSRILGDFHEPVVLEALVNLLKTSEGEDLIATAAIALTNFGSAAIAALTDLLAEPRTRMVATRSLCVIGGPASVPPLLNVVGEFLQQDSYSSGDPALCAMALEALSNSTDPAITPLLLQALKHTAAPIRRAATIGLGLRSDLLAQLDLVSLLQERLWDFNFEVCQAATIALSRLGTPAAAIALARLLQSPQTPVPLQIEAVRALGWIGTPIALEQLQSAIAIAPVPALREIISVLGRLTDLETQIQATQILLQLLNSSLPNVQFPPIKQAIALSLGQLGQPQAFDALVQLLADSDKSVQLHAIAALRQLEAYPNLEQLSHSRLSPELAQGVATALQELKV